LKNTLFAKLLGPYFHRLNAIRATIGAMNRSSPARIDFTG